MTKWQKHIIGLAGMMLGCVWQLSAQSDAMLSQYFLTPIYYNAGAAGTSDGLNITATGQLQHHTDIMYRNAGIGADIPVAVGGSDNLGIGITTGYTGAGDYRGLSASLPLSWRLKAGSGHISICIAPGMSDGRITPDDKKRKHKTRFDFGAGLWYCSKGFRAGISATHIGQKRRDTCAGMAFYAFAAGNTAIKGTLLNMEPSILIARRTGDFIGQISLRAIWKRVLWAGAGYRLHESAVVMLGISIKGLRAGYSYLLPSKHLHGGHELMAGYSCGINTQKSPTGRHKSVRLM